MSEKNVKVQLLSLGSYYSAPPPPFHVNRPFLYYLKYGNIVLFAGKTRKPTFVNSVENSNKVSKINNKPTHFVGSIENYGQRESDPIYNKRVEKPAQQTNFNRPSNIRSGPVKYDQQDNYNSPSSTFNRPAYTENNGAINYRPFKNFSQQENSQNANVNISKGFVWKP